MSQINIFEFVEHKYTPPLYFDKPSKVVSNSQLYKQAGNGIVVDVFSAILKNLIRQEK